MEILVCVKQVVDDAVEISLGANGTPDFGSAEQVVNAFDTYALEMATRLKEAKGGEITVLSIGDESVNNSLKNCLAVGADNAYLVSNDKYQDSDCLAIASNLDKAITEIENKTGKKFDLIFCGLESTDFASGQVGAMLANNRKIALVTNVVDIDVNDKVEAKQETEDGYNAVEASLPVLVTVNKPNYDPRYPTIKSKMAARKKSIESLNTWSDSDKHVEVYKIYEPKKREAGVKIQEEDINVAVNNAINLMTEAKVL